MPMHDWTRVDDGIYHDFHTAWIAELRKVLNAGRLPAGYYALAEQMTGEFGPNDLTLRQADSTGEDFEGGVAVALAPPKVEVTAVTDLMSYTARRRTLVIRHRSGDQVVAMVELVSPGNKNSRARLDAFVHKACSAIAAGVHLLIVDPFPPGKRDPAGLHGAIWAELQDDAYELPADQPLALAAYASGAEVTARVHAFRVGESKPDMPLFLTPDRYVLVELERTYLEAWSGTPAKVKSNLA